MTLIKTSYFGNWRNFPKDYTQISVAQYSPPAWSGDIFKELAPSVELLYKWKQNKITEKEYKNIYLAELNSKFMPEEVLEKLPEKSLLLCYEKAGSFCHRHILADWLGYKDCEL